MNWSPMSPITRRRSRWRYPVAWLWLAEIAVSWSLVIAAGYACTAIAVHLAGW
jgi:hypothetical protein